MPWRSRLIASVRSSRSVTRLVVLRLDLAQLLLGAQIDGAEPLAVAPQLVEPLLDRRDLGQRVARRDLGERRDVRGLGLEHLADFVRDVGGAPVRRPRAAPRRAPARCAHRPSPRARRAPPCRPRRARSRRRRGGRRLRAARLRPASISAISARRCSAKAAGAPSSEAALGLRVAEPLLQRRDLAGGARLAAVPFGALGRDRGEALRAQLGLARERLRFAARFRQHGALRRDLAARFRELVFQLGGRAERLDRLRGVALGGERLVAARREADLGLGERREPRGQAVRLALGRGMRVARRVGLRLRLAPRIARFAFGRDRGGELGFRRFDRAALAVGIGARVAELGVEIGEAVLRREPARGRGRRIRGGRKAVPAPQVAFGRDQPLAGLAAARRASRPSARSTTPICASRRASSGGAVTWRASGSAPSGSAGSLVGRGAGPADRRGRIDRRLEIVAERRAERGLVALLDGEQVDRRRPELLCLDVDQLGERLRLGLEPVRRAARPRRAVRAPRRAPGAPPNAPPRRAAPRPRPPRPRPARPRPRPRAPHIRRAVLRLVEARQARSRPRRSGLRAASAAPNARLIARSSWLRRATRSASAPVSSPNVFSTAASAASAALTRAATSASRSATPAPVLRQAGFLGRQAAPARPRRRPAGAARARCPATSCASRRSSSSDALVDARFLAVERLARHHEALQRGAGLGLLVAQRRQSRRPRSPDGWRLRPARRSPRRRGGCSHPWRGSASATSALRRDPAQMEQRRLGLAHVGRHLLVLAPPGAPGASAHRSAAPAGRSRPRAAPRLVSAAFSRSSASWRRACRPATPAASSSTRRRCSGLAWMISPMRP